MGILKKKRKYWKKFHCLFSHFQQLRCIILHLKIPSVFSFPLGDFINSAFFLFLEGCKPGSDSSFLESPFSCSRHRSGLVLCFVLCFPLLFVCCAVCLHHFFVLPFLWHLFLWVGSFQWKNFFCPFFFIDLQWFQGATPKVILCSTSGDSAFLSITEVTVPLDLEVRKKIWCRFFQCSVWHRFRAPLSGRILIEHRQIDLL